MTSNRPPGPEGHLVWGHLPELIRDRTRFLEECARTYGDVVGLRFGPKPVVLLSHPAHIEDVLVTHQDQFAKPYALRVTRVALDNAPARSDSSFWRRSMAPAFAPRRLAAYGSDVVAATQDLLATWQSGETRDLHAEMTRLSLDILGRTLFGLDVRDEAAGISAATAELMDAFIRGMQRPVPVPGWLPTPGNRRRRRATRALLDLVERIIAARQTNPSALRRAHDLLAMLLAPDAADRFPGIDVDPRDAVLTLLLAGHETVALALTWAWYLLATHPSVAAELIAELDRVLGGRVPTAADERDLRYTTAILREALRLYPPIWVMARVARGDRQLGDWSVRAGTVVLMSQWVVQRDPRYFARPETFDPQRWTDGLADRLPRYAYFPFGGGVRGCIGSRFAMMEATLALATMAQQVRLTLCPARAILPHPSVTLQPRERVAMALHRR